MQSPALTPTGRLPRTRSTRLHFPNRLFRNSRGAEAQLRPGFDLLEVLDDFPAVLVEDPVADQPKRGSEDAAPGIRPELADPNHLDPAAAVAPGRLYLPAAPGDRVDVRFRYGRRHRIRPRPVIVAALPVVADAG